MGPSARRYSLLAVSLILAFFLTQQIINALAQLSNTLEPELYLRRSVLALAGFFVPVIGGWLAFRFVGGLIFSLYAVVMVFFINGISRSGVASWLIAEYLLLGYVLQRIDQYYENQIAGLSVDREKYQNERNDLDVSYKAKGEGISIFFEKYSTYYNLRKLAEELATTLSVTQLAAMVIERASEFIPRGDVVVITLADTAGKHLSVFASKRLQKEAQVHSKQGDLFDFWAVKNRKRLIVTDSHQDFRFDLNETARQEHIRGLILAPLYHEGRVVGTLRINSSRPNAFSNDDLRLLDAIAALASSALSNAMLFERTEELAIRDSLTGLYLRRHFFERLKQEHRRALLTKRPLSILLCDLDHFKECNDRYGHAAGDQMLIQFADLLKGCSENAVVARYGGEEFAILLPEVSKAGAFEAAEKIRLKIESHPFTLRREAIRITTSIGVATHPDDTLDMELLIQKSDEALYRAKREGRNRVC
jgi:diguanylate cyclase (GGDEF)-like protein